MLVAPSILAADFSRLGEEVERISSADLIHIDIMDGIFVPNISIGPGVVRAIRDKTELAFDVHLMLIHPLKYIDQFAESGADGITFHAECDDDPICLIESIKKAGKKPGAALKPATGVSEIRRYAKALHMVTVMTVEPGFGGQGMMLDMLEKVRELKAEFPHLLVEVDGGVNRNTIAACRSAGVDVVVAGTSVMKADSPNDEIVCLRGL